MRRREFVTLVGGVAAGWSVAAKAQQPDRVRTVAVLMVFAENDPEGQVRAKAFQRKLEDLGWSVGRNIRIDYHWVTDPDRIGNVAAEVVRMGPDVILAYGNQLVAALRRETRSIPIVFVQVTNPDSGGLVASLAHPGGNITGFSQYVFAIGGKWLDTLKEIAPNTRRVAIILNPDNPTASGYLGAIEAMAPSLGVQVTPTAGRDAPDIERAMEIFSHATDGGVIVLPDFVIFRNRSLVIALAARYHLPAIYPTRFFVTNGGLLSYGIDQVEMSRQAATYVDRILKCEKPADLPVQAPTKFELVVNLKTANALGLKVPPTLLTRADEVIE
jgi:putative tryptophan/tyrosine transport system substrate-binding protein